MNVTEKLLFLSGVKANKATLFGKFSDELSREDKVEAWTNVVTTLQAHGVSLALEKSVTYFWDTVWPNLRRYTMEKTDRKSRTGEGGGKGAKWTEVDELVLDIVGMDSPAVCGLRGCETWESEEASEGPSATEAGESASTTVLRPLGEENVPPPCPQTSTRRQCVRKRQNDFLSEFRRKKLVKIDLEIENLQLRNALLRKQLNEQAAVITEGDLSYRAL